jgi:hypothetical protein
MMIQNVMRTALVEVVAIEHAERLTSKLRACTPQLANLNKQPVTALLQSCEISVTWG